MEERLKFIQELESESETMAELCREFGISRKTGYKWQERYQKGGAEALAEQSRARHTQANAVSGAVRQAVIRARTEHRNWGPRTLHHWLKRKQAEVSWPSPSTIAEILRQAGLTQSRGKRLWVAPTPNGLETPGEANHIWCADFKGYFHCKDGTRCDPLTIMDAYSRYLLRCQLVWAVEGNYTRAWFENAFREYGLPERIRTDNGPPFATVALGGLSELAVYWIKLGILPERIKPGKPQQNGRHERMHRTLKACTAQPPAGTQRPQQERFDQFRREYNEERPHQALDMQTPASQYTVSPRCYPKRVRLAEYGSDRKVRTVGSCGRIRWSGERVFITKALQNEPIGLEGTEDGIWRLWYGHYPIGWLDERTMQASDLDRHPKRKLQAKEEKAEQPKRAEEMTVCPADLGKR
jgi:transposase InsO family protein